MRGRILVAAVFLLTACSTQAASDARYLLLDGSIEGPSRLTGSVATAIQVGNSGEYQHTLVVTNETGQVLGATGVVDSGEQASLRLDLEPGVYSFSCRIVAEDNEGNLVDHYELGMHRTVTVTG